MDIAIIDIVFFGIIAVFALRCAIKGAVSELLSMAALIFGLLAAVFFFRKTAVIIHDKFIPDIKALPEIISFIIIFLTVFAIIKLLEALLKKFIKGIELNGPDHFLGFIFGFAEGVVIVCLVLFFINIQPFFDPGIILQKSFFAKILLPVIMENKKNSADSPARVIMLGGKIRIV